MQSTFGVDEEGRFLEDRLAAPGLSPAEEVGGTGLGERIERAVEMLSPEQKEVFLLRMYGDTPFKEIAKIQKCSINTCLARMQYSLGKLRSILKEEYEELRETMP
jgi:RNA polymerase sigma-70 factor (ECF subfamily)